MTTATTIAALQAIHETILQSFHPVDGLVHAPDGTTGKEFPAAVTSELLPLCILRPAAYDLQAAGRDIIQGSRVYRGFVMVYPLPSPPDEGINAAIVQAWAIQDAYRSRYITLIATEETIDSGDVVSRYQETSRGNASAEGADIVIYRRAGWLGFTFLVNVWEAA